MFNSLKRFGLIRCLGNHLITHQVLHMCYQGVRINNTNDEDFLIKKQNNNDNKQSTTKIIIAYLITHQVSTTSILNLVMSEPHQVSQQLQQRQQQH